MKVGLKKKQGGQKHGKQRSNIDYNGREENAQRNESARYFVRGDFERVHIEFVCTRQRERPNKKK